MAGNYVKYNQRCKPYVAYPPSLEKMVEILVRMAVKSELDLRCDFWEVSLTEKSQRFNKFCCPIRKSFRWCCMPFGLQGAPDIFQELIEQVWKN